MIITQKKPIDELLEMLGNAKRVALVGCGSCATVCATGGDKEIGALTAVLEARGMRVVATAISEYCCMHLKTRTALKPVLAARPGSVIALNNRGVVLRRLGRPEEAAAAFRRVRVFGVGPVR